MKITVLKENLAGEKRVALVPGIAQNFIKKGWQVCVEKDAGLLSGFLDQAYIDVGASILSDRKELFKNTQLFLKIRPPEKEDIDLFPENSCLMSFIMPHENQDLLETLNQKKMTVWAMEQVPRITRAQSVDALSSMANVAGYRAVVVAVEALGRFLGAQSTAAGSFPPARVLVIGAGVAGLSALGAARSLGALVEAFDTRPEVKEQIQSMGADFLTINIDELGSGEGGYAKKMSEAFLEAEIELFKTRAPHVDIIISTALIPGRPAPVLITDEVIELMKPGSVIVDLAAEAGGNCSQTQPQKRVLYKGVHILGDTNFPSQMAAQSSQMYSKNLQNLIQEITKTGDNLEVNHEDEMILRTTVCENGKVLWPHPPMKPAASAVKIASETKTTVQKQASKKEVSKKQAPKKKAVLKKPSLLTNLIVVLVVTASLMGLAQVLPSEFMSRLTVFVLSCFIGWQVVWNVTPALHTPLMSVTNAISGIIIIGALSQIGSTSSLVLSLVFVAIFIATINIVGGFWVTQRMLKMFEIED